MVFAWETAMTLNQKALHPLMQVDRFIQGSVSVGGGVPILVGRSLS